MRKKLYFARTNAYDMLISDDGERRLVLTDNNAVDLNGVYREYEKDFNYRIDTEEPKKWEDIERALCWKYLVEAVEDDSSWEEYEEPVEKLIEDAEILAQIEKDL